MILRLLANRTAASFIKKPLSAPDLIQFLSRSAAQNTVLSTPHFNVVDYLIKSCGLSPEKSVRVSKSISRLRSPETPDAALIFFKHEGFTEADIKILIALHPTLLCFPQKALDTNLRALRDIGLSDSALKHIILSGPAALMLPSAVPRIMFWRDFLQGDEAALVKTFKRTLNLVSHDISRIITPKLSFLQTQGLLPQDLRKILLHVPRFITSSAPAMEDLLKRTKELGFQPGSKMFVHGLAAMIRVSRDLLRGKMELFRSFGWSEQEFLTALRMAPGMICISDDKLRVKMHFLMGEARCEPSYIASHPLLVKLSLEKRLRPRQHVLHLLESNGLSSKTAFSYAMKVPDTTFAKRYIAPHKEKIPGLHEACIAAFTV